MALDFVDLKTQYARLREPIRARIDAVLEHGKFILGPEVAELESRLAAFAGAKHAIGVSSGSDALMMALMAADIGPGDAVFLPAFTFTATAEVVLLVGARPVFVDIDRASFNIAPESLAAAVETVAAAGEFRPRAAIAVDLYGLPADYAALADIAQAHELLIVADAAQSFGARQGDRQVGTLAPITATSFFPAKPLGGYGDGGALFCQDDELAERFRSIRAHGKGGAKYDIVRVGLNARLDTLQAAILLAKLDVFDDELASRRRLAEGYQRRLGSVVATPASSNSSDSAWAQYTLVVDERDEVQKILGQSGIPTAIYYPKPMHLQTAYAGFGDGAGSLPVSEFLADHVLGLPMHPYLSDEHIGQICDAVKAAVSGAQGHA